MKYSNIKKRNDETRSIADVCLKNLGVASTDEINAWFQKSYDHGYRIDGIDNAIELIENGDWERIHIVGDYDVDGETATAQMVTVLKELGYPVTYRIPKRFSEGFGLNRQIIDELPDGKILIITVDNGVAALEAVKAAKERGFTIIVTDHHLPPITENGSAILPEADLIIDPNAIPGSADFTGYCGAGIANRIVTRILEKRIESLPFNDENTLKLRALKANMQVLAMIGTVCDVMQLREENYVIVRNGLKKLNMRVAPMGVLALCDQLYLEHPTATDIAFKLGPALNANARLFDEGADLSVRLLCGDIYNEVCALAQSSVTNNVVRKQLVSDGLKQAEEIISANGWEKDLPMVLFLPDAKEGVIGIVASSLCEKYRTTVMVFTRSDKDGILKGSGRSIEGVHLKDLLDAAADEFEVYGGHAGAAGMSVREDNLDHMREALQAEAAKRGYTPLDAETLYFDLSISAAEVENALAQLERFAPFGEGNRPLVFEIKNFKLAGSKQVIGADGKTVKLTAENGMNALGFSMSEEFETSNALSYTLYGELGYNYFKGERTPQILFTAFEETPAEAVATKPKRAKKVTA